MSSMRQTPAPRLESWPPRACAGRDPNVWFPNQGQGEQSVRARRICWTCPAREPCAAYAIPIVDLVGVWGAMTVKDRAKERRKREAG